jgi:hypothetical protein
MSRRLLSFLQKNIAGSPFKKIKLEALHFSMLRAGVQEQEALVENRPNISGH